MIFSVFSETASFCLIRKSTLQDIYYCLLIFFFFSLSHLIPNLQLSVDICICFTKRIPLNSKFMTFALIKLWVASVLVGCVPRSTPLFIRGIWIMRHQIICSTFIESPVSHVKNKATNTDFPFFVRRTSYGRTILG